MSDGHLNVCIACVKTRVHKRYQRLSQTDPGWVRREAERQRTKQTKRYYEIKHDEAYRRRMREKSRRYSISNREKRQAHSRVWTAIASGELQRPNRCARCKVRGPVEGHHADYSKPLNVEWLCVKCHRDETWVKKYPHLH